MQRALNEVEGMKEKENSTAVLEARQLTKSYDTAAGEVRAVDRVDLRIEKGDFLALMGPSGSGKTTLLSMLGALEPPTEGQVMLRDREIGKMTERELAQLRRFDIGFVFQSFYLVDHLTAQENVRFPLGFNKDYSPDEKEQRASELLRMVGLEDRSDHFPRQLSGGEKQRVAIARALANSPAVVLADEPTGNLDQESGDSVMEAFEDLHQRLGQTVVMVTHDPLVAQRARRVVRLKSGRVVEDQEQTG